MKIKKPKFLSLRSRQSRHGGFSLVELIVVIAIMAIFTAILVPSLISYTERSRAQRDVSAMDEVANAVYLSMSNPFVYEELAKASLPENVSCYVDSNNEDGYAESIRITTKSAVYDGEHDQYTFGDEARRLDEAKYYAAGNMWGVTITFEPNHDSGKDRYILADAVINKFLSNGTKKLSDYPNLYHAVRSAIDSEVEIISRTYGNSDYTVFVTVGTTGGNDVADAETMNAYGQYSGTNLPAGEIKYYCANGRGVTKPELGTESGGVHDCTHDYTSNITKTPTCADEGEKTYTCKNCGDSYTEELGKKTDNHVGGVDIIYTCVDASTHTKEEKCKGCGATLSSTTESHTSIDSCDDCGYEASIPDPIDPPVLIAGNGWFTEGNSYITDKTLITTINIQANPYTPSGDLNTDYYAWNGSEADDGSIMVYAEKNADGTTYTLTIAGNGADRIMANANSSNAFNGFTKVTAINGLALLDTSNVTNMDSMFYNCSGLTSLDVSGFDTTNVTSMIWMFSGCSKLTSLDVSSFDTSNVTNMNYMFQNCSKLTLLDVSGFDTANVTQMSGMFNGCSGLTSLNVSGFNTANVTKMDGMFSRCSGLTSLNVSCFNTVNVTTMGRMFESCSGLTALNLSNFNTAKVTNMRGMFEGCSGLTSLYVSGFNTANVTKMDGMFYGCSKLTSLDVSGFNTSNVTNMYQMFQDCSGLTALNISNFNTAKVTNMTNMFLNCSSLTSLDLSGFNTSKVTQMTWMFNGMTSLNTITIGAEFKFVGTNGYLPATASGKWYDVETNVGYTPAEIATFQKAATYISELPKPILAAVETWFTTNPHGIAKTSVTTINIVNQYTPSGTAGVDYYAWNGSEADDGSIMVYAEKNADGTTYTLTIAGNGADKICANADSSYMFKGYTKVTKINGLELLDTANVTKTNYMFHNCSSLTSLDLSSFETTNVTNMFQMFYGCSSLSSLTVSSFNTTNVTNTSGMFWGCSSLLSLNLSNFNTANVNNMSYMFSDCSKLTSLDLSNFNTSNVTNMGYMFQNCSGLTSLNVSSFNTANTNDMTSMFYGCSGLASLSVSNFNTSNVTAITQMFRGCSGLKSLNVTGFVTTNVTSMSSMFHGCSGLKSLNVTGFVTTNVTSMSSMFHGCSGLTSLDVTKFDTTNVTSMSNMFQGCSGLTSLDLSSFDTVSVKYMSSMFYNCSGLTSLNLSNFNTSGVTSHSNAFYGCNNLATITIGDQFTIMSSLTAPSSVYITGADGQWYSTTTGQGYAPSAIPVGVAATYVAVLKDFTVTAETRGKIGYTGAAGESLSIPEIFQDEDGTWYRVVGIGYEAFKGCSNLTNVTIPDSVTSIGGRAFQYCSSLTGANIPSGVTSIGDSTFYGCYALTGELIIPDSVTNIGTYAFYDCTMLTSVDLGSVTSIARKAFYGCYRLTNITIPASVTQISGNAFMRCYGLSSINVDTNNAVYHSADNCLIETATNSLIAGCKNSVIPNYVANIGGEAFYECYDLTSVTIPNSVTSIGDYAFYGCYELASITLPTNVISIGTDAFPTPSNSDIPGADGKWYSVTTGTGYAPTAIPTGTADTYVAIKPEVITFKIDGVQYQAMNYMTWAQWVESDYNTAGFWITSYGRGNLVDSNGRAVVLITTKVDINEKISEGTSYAIETSSMA